MSTPAPARAPAPVARRPSALVAMAAIAGNQLQRAGRDRTALFFTVVLPVTIIVLIGFSVGDGDLRVGVLDHDGSERAAALVERLDAAEDMDVATYGSLERLRRDVRTGAAVAGVVVPEDFGARLEAGDTTTVQVVADPTSSGAAAVQAAVQAAVAEEAARIAAARFAAERTGLAYDDAAATVARISAAVAPAAVRTIDVTGEEERDTFGVDYTAPANLVLFVFVNTLVVGAVLASERRQGIVRRMLATPHGTGTILGGLAVARLAFALGQSAVIVVVGAVFFGVDWGDPLAAATLILLFAVVSTATGLLVGATVSDAEQAQAIATPVAIGMGMLGGCMWPLAIVPDVMRTIGHVTPHAWAVDAWIELVYDDGGFVDVLPQLAVLAGFAVVLGTLAVRRLRIALTS